jgi:purine-cytosine permease-like protein
MAENTPDPKQQKALMALYAGVLFVYFGVIVFGLYNSLATGKSLMQAIGDNGGSLAIFAACLALFAASLAGQKKK